MDNSVWNDDELGTYNLTPINEINPSQDFNLQQENTALGPLQDLNPQQETPEPELLPPQVETNHGHQFNQAAEPSPEPSRRGRRAKLSELQRRLNKKMSDRKHRQKLKDNMVNLIKEKEKIEKEATEMKLEKEQIKLEYELQKKYIQQLEELIKALKSQSDVWMTDVEGQSDEMIKELLECQPCNATVPAAAAEFYRKVEENEGISLDFKDFRDLHEKQEYRTVGKYQIPLSLVPTAEKITEVYGDVCATSTISRNFAENIYTLFCATIKEMDELPLEEVTEETMLKWRTAIKDALCIKFKVEFAMEHLKKTIAGRYFGMKPYKEAEKIDDEISKAEARLNGLKECKMFRDIAKEFDGKPLSEGLWG